MRINVSRRIEKKILNDLRIYTRKDKWKCDYVSAVYYKGKRLKRYAESCRYIYKLNNNIIKIEVEDIKTQTLNEISFNEIIRQKDRKYFAKILEHDGSRGIIVQEFIDLAKGERSAESRNIIKKLERKYQFSDICSDDNYNWGINKITNNPIIYDWGFT